MKVWNRKVIAIFVVLILTYFGTVHSGYVKEGYTQSFGSTGSTTGTSGRKRSILPFRTVIQIIGYVLAFFIVVSIGAITWDIFMNRRNSNNQMGNNTNNNGYNGQNYSRYG